jgi:transcriptional accessory protein Tex/SPT6
MASRRRAKSSPTISTMSERWATAPSHRALAMLRGWNEEVLTLTIEADAETRRR